MWSIFTKVNANLEMLSLGGIDRICGISSVTAWVICIRETSPVGILIINYRDWVLSVELVMFPSSCDIGTCIFVVFRPLLVAD